VARSLSLTAVLSLLLAGCAADLGAAEAAAREDSPYREIWDLGLTRYVGAPEVQPTEVTSGWLSRVDVHRFSGDPALHGPLCMRGAPFFVETRDGSSDELMIFLQGGGVCLDEICAQTSTPALSLRLMETADVIGIGGVLDGDPLSNNPLKRADVVHVPYCDGSIFTGDVDRTLSDGNPDNGTDDVAYQRGLVNMTAAFEVAKATYPNPSRVIIAGTSGGSMGSIAALALARYYYPEHEIVIVADSGMPVLRDHDPDFVYRALEQIDALRYIPPSCPDCLARGHVTGVLEWALARDDKLRIGVMAHSGDRTIGQFFMQSPPEEYGAAWVRETDRLSSAFPGRVNRFIAPGEHHTFVLDVGDASWDITQQIILYLFGSIALDGDDAVPSELGQWTLGGMKETSIDPNGRRRSGYHWLRSFLHGGTAAYDATQLE
jgi:hypothetical protein